MHQLPQLLQAISSSHLGALLKTLTAEAGLCSRVYSSLGSTGAAIMVDSKAAATPATYVEYAYRYAVQLL